jgi:hypothetical protein
VGLKVVILDILEGSASRQQDLTLSFILYNEFPGYIVVDTLGAIPVDSSNGTALPFQDLDIAFGVAVLKQISGANPNPMVIVPSSPGPGAMADLMDLNSFLINATQNSSYIRNSQSPVELNPCGTFAAESSTFDFIDTPLAPVGQQHSVQWSSGAGTGPQSVASAVYDPVFCLWNVKVYRKIGATVIQYFTFTWNDNVPVQQIFERVVFTLALSGIVEGIDNKLIRISPPIGCGNAVLHQMIRLFQGSTWKGYFLDPSESALECCDKFPNIMFEFDSPQLVLLNAGFMGCTTYFIREGTSELFTRGLTLLYVVFGNPTKGFQLKIMLSCGNLVVVNPVFPYTRSIQLQFEALISQANPCGPYACNLRWVCPSRY